MGFERMCGLKIGKLEETVGESLYIITAIGPIV